MASLLVFGLVFSIIILIIDGIINQWAYPLENIFFDIVMGFFIGLCVWSLICVMFSPNPSVKTEENFIIINETKCELIDKNYDDKKFYLVQQLDNANGLSYSYDYLNKKGQMCHKEANAINTHIYYISENEDPYDTKKRT